MSQQSNISGPGIGLPIPQNLYPSELQNAPYDYGANLIPLAPGDWILVPAGTSYIDASPNAILQFLDPITGIWRGFNAFEGWPQIVTSDGYTRRIANLTGCAVAAQVVAGGSGYSQATATVAAGSGSSTWQPIVGGALSVVSVGTAGKGYTMQPIVLISAPPSASANGYGGVQATAVATVTGTSISAVSLTNVGAGYTSLPTITVLPNPGDPNIGTITQASVTLGLVNSGAITACLCTNPGAPLTTAYTNIALPTMTVAGAGGSAGSVSAVVMQTVVGASISSSGFGYGANTELSTYGGVPVASSTYVNPAIEQNLYRPRKASIGLTVTAGSVTAIGTIYDGGLFLGAPSAILITQGAPTSTAASIILQMGSSNATVIMQQL